MFSFGYLGLSIDLDSFQALLTLSPLGFGSLSVFVWDRVSNFGYHWGIIALSAEKC